jgi:hypothetical protein
MSREEQLTWAKQRALICVDMGDFSDAVAGLRADLDANPLTKGVMSSEQALRGYKAAMDAALGRGSQALTEDRGPQVKLRHMRIPAQFPRPFHLMPHPFPASRNMTGPRKG